MPSKISYSKNGSLIQPTMFKKNLTRFWPFMLIYGIYLIILYPMTLHVELSDQYYSISQNAATIVAEHFSMLREPVSIFFMSMLMAMAVFSYLYQSRSANMIHAFPVTRTQLFVTNYASGLIMLLLPQFVCALLTNLVLLGKADSVLWSVWAWFGTTVGETLFFYGFACLMVMFTGQLFTSALFYLIWNLVYVAASALVSVVSSLFLYGVSTDLSVTNSVLCPLWYMMRRIGLVYNFADGAYGTEGIPALFGFAAVGIVFAVLAWFLYRKRRVECAGDFLSMKWTAPVFRWGVVLIGGTAVALFLTYMFHAYASWNGRVGHFVFWLIVFGAMLFFVSEMFIEKSVRVFKKRIITECVCCIAVLLVGVALLHFDVFGMESYVPQAEQVENAVLAWQNEEVVFDTPEKLAQMEQLHELLVSHISEQKRNTDGNADYTSVVEDNEPWYGFMTLTYELKDGSRVHRQYNIATADAAFSDELQSQLGALFSDSHAFVAAFLGLDHEELDWRMDYVYLEAAMPAETASEDAGEYTYSMEELAGYETEPEMQAFFEAFCADIDAGAFVPQQEGDSRMDACLNFSFKIREPKSEIRYADASSAGYVLQEQVANETAAYYNISITERCTHTIDALIELGVIDSVEDLYTER